MFTSIPVEKAIQQVCAGLEQQCNMVEEAKNYERLYKMFLDDSGVLVPTVYKEFCSDDWIVLEFMPNLKKITDPSITKADARTAVDAALNVIYYMIFVEGFVHCDLHPGNLLINNEGRIVLLDAGLVVSVDISARHNFAEFFFALSVGDSNTVSRIIIETAELVPEAVDLWQFRHDISEFVLSYFGRRAGDFILSSFIWELFRIMRIHGIRGTPEFIMIVGALAVFEGLVRQHFPEIEFQKAALPFILHAFREKSYPDCR